MPLSFGPRAKISGFLCKRLYTLPTKPFRKLAGSGAVLHGLLTSRAFYLDKAGRNILVGPFWPSDEPRRAAASAPRAKCCIAVSIICTARRWRSASARSSRNSASESSMAGRKFANKETGVTSTPEILLIDVSRYDAAAKINKFKYDLWKTFGIESTKFENVLGFPSNTCGWAQPAIAALHALGEAGTELEPAVILSHEYMGMPTALAAILEGDRSNFRTIFYAHEVAPMRRIVEGHPGHDTMFYNVMRAAMAQGNYVEDVFGDQSGYYKHALVNAARFCDGIFAVGDYALKEIRFMGPDFVHVDSQIAYNGVPCWKISVEQKMASRRKLQAYCNAAPRLRAGLCLLPCHPARSQQRPVARPARAGTRRAHFARSQ